MKTLSIVVIVSLCLLGCESTSPPLESEASGDSASKVGVEDADMTPDSALEAEEIAEPVVDTGPAPEPVYACPERPMCGQDYCDQVFIAESEFVMGSEHAPNAEAYWPSGDERPPHAVALSPYCIDRFEVTLERYESCVDAGFCAPEGLQWDNPKADGFDTTVNHYPPECWPDREPCKHHAVNGKNYHQAQNYCSWIGARLCTEAEWERAAKGPGSEPQTHPWGNGPMTSELVNVPSTGPGWVDPVFYYAAGTSPEGVYNMAGNVYEWVRDAYTLYQPGPGGEPLVDPVFPPTSADAQLVARGSCFFTEPTRTTSERSLFAWTFDWG